MPHAVQKSAVCGIKPIGQMNTRKTTRECALRAIYDAFGITEEALIEQRRKRGAVYARFIYANLRHDGINAQQIADELNKSRSTVDYYLSRYNEAYLFDSQFRKAANKVAEIIKSYDEDDNSN